MLKGDYEKIKHSEEFNKIFSDSFLISCFLNETAGNEENSVWEYNFYSPETKKINSFFVRDGKVHLRDASELTSIKEPEELNLNNLNLRKPQVTSIVNDFLKKEHKNEKPSKTIIIVESENNKIIWSLVLILESSKMISLKISDEKFNIIEKKIITLNEMIAGVK
ncbi:hypothetical protein HYX16_05120 [Candidatus Woesearchaeota archaeon]|nr:hypothetical protein [Candidatus Woesearchaeota archaeon]